MSIFKKVKNRAEKLNTRLNGIKDRLSNFADKATGKGGAVDITRQPKATKPKEKSKLGKNISNIVSHVAEDRKVKTKPDTPGPKWSDELNYAASQRNKAKYHSPSNSSLEETSKKIPSSKPSNIKQPSNIKRNLAIGGLIGGGLAAAAYGAHKYKNRNKENEEEKKKPR